QITIEVDGPTFTTYTTNAKAGIATFNVTLTAAGDYDVFAHEGPPYTDSSTTAAPTADCSNTFYETDEFFPLTVVTIPANAPIAPCPPDTSCVQTTSGSGTQATLIAVAGSTWSPKAATYFEPFAGAGFQCGTSTP